MRTPPVHPKKSASFNCEGCINQLTSNISRGSLPINCECLPINYHQSPVLQCSSRDFRPASVFIQQGRAISKLLWQAASAVALGSPTIVECALAFECALCDKQQQQDFRSASVFIQQGRAISKYQASSFSN